MQFIMKASFLQVTYQIKKKFTVNFDKIGVGTPSKLFSTEPVCEYLDCIKTLGVRPK